MTPLNHARLWDDVAWDFQDRATRAALRQQPQTAEGWAVMSRLARGVADAYRRHARGEVPLPPDPQGLPASPEPPATEDRHSPAAAGPNDFDVVTDQRWTDLPDLPRFPGSDE